MLRYKRFFTVLLLLSMINAGFVIAKPVPKGSPPNIPEELAVSNVTANSLSLSWLQSPGASGYKIYRAASKDADYTLIASVGSTTYSDMGLNSGTSYWYFVQAFNSYGISEDSTHVEAVIEQPLPSSKKVVGYATYYYSGDASSYNSITAKASLLDEIATDTFTTDSLGNLTGVVPTDQLDYANSKEIKVLAMITNKFDGNIAKVLLESPSNRQTLIKNILSALKTNDYKGVNVDIEGIFHYDRSYFTIFMSELYNTLHPLGYIVTAAVPAKTSDAPKSSWGGAYDYGQLSKYADQIMIMAYDEHYPGSTPGPVASIGWVQDVADYALTVIPKEKIILGVAAYGYDWSSNGTKAYSISQVNKLASTHGAHIQWDLTSQSPYFSYTDSKEVEHTVWFENNTSLGYKLDIVNNSGLSGISIWRLGLEDSNYWTTIKTKFNK